MKRTLKSAISALAENLEKTESLRLSIADELGKLKEKRERIEKFVLESADERLAEVPEIVASLSPFVAWKATPITDGSTIAAHMAIDDRLIPEVENERKALKAVFEAQLDILEGHMLQRLTEAGTSSTSVSGVGRAEKRLETKYSIPDKKLFIDWAVANGAESELTISVRPNSKFMAKVVEDQGDLPPGISHFKAYKCVVVKA